MIEALAPAYLWLKWLHILALVSWMAGLFYLPRLFVYHVESAPENAKPVFETMEFKLQKYIMTPAMLVTWLTGILLALSPFVDLAADGWLYVKVALVIAMTGFHGFCGKWRKALAAGTNSHGGRYFRIANEVPTLLFVVIVAMVIFKPF